LELLTPMQLGVINGLPSAGSVVDLRRDCVPLVLAEGNRCAVFYMHFVKTIEVAFDELIQAVVASGLEDPSWAFVHEMVAALGSVPGTPAPPHSTTRA
jgi:hypothetical protein